MHVTTTPAPKSSVLLEVELPPERLDRSMDEAVRRLARRTRVAGFRPGKAPRFMLERVLGPTAVLDEAVDILLQDAYRDALTEQGIVPLTQASVDVVQAEEGKPFKFTATVQVPPDVVLGDYAGLQVRGPRSRRSTTPRSQTVIDELRDQNATLRPVEERPAQTGDYAVIGFVGTRDGVPFEGGTSERMPLILGEERLIPGFEAHLVGLSVGGSTEFDIDFPEDYGEPTLAGQTAHFAVDLKELREKILPDARRRLRPVDGRLRRPRRAPGRDPPTARAQCARSGPPRVRRPDHRVRSGQRDRRAAGHPRRPGGRGHPRRVPVEPGPPGDRRGGLPQGGPSRPRPTSTPSSGRAPRAGSRRCSSCRRSPRSRGSRSPRPTSRPRSPRPGSATPTTRGRSPTSTRSAGGTSSEHAPPDADGRGPRRRLAGRPSGSSGAAPLRGGR